MVITLIRFKASIFVCQMYPKRASTTHYLNIFLAKYRKNMKQFNLKQEIRRRIINFPSDLKNKFQLDFLRMTHHLKCLTSIM